MREGAGLSRLQLARKLDRFGAGFSVHIIKDWEAGKRNIPPVKAMVLTEVLTKGE